ncbi:serine protease [Litoribrevibacter euphylliae]|uniref:Serine protease n=1 Tax=Litoribrevibacter euphylliae TaxID=1834034 RepID=A0ABV7HFG8_9GAMM
MNSSIKKISIIILALIITGCSVRPYSNIEAIKTDAKLAEGISLPYSISAAYYAPSEELSRVDKALRGNQYNVQVELVESGKAFNRALDLVLTGYFSKVEKLAPKSKFDVLFKFKSKPTWDRIWGRCNVELETTVNAWDGEELFSISTKGAVQANYEENCVMNAYAEALEEAIIEFVNKAQHLRIDKTEKKESFFQSGNFEKYFSDLKPTSTGTGFYVSKNGDLMTASHVVNECFMLKVKEGEEVFPATLSSESKLLDVAILKTDKPRKGFLNVRSLGNDLNILGNPVEVVGYPLSGILSDSPSLTVGNVTSLNGLKGSKSIFQYSAPIQPGNSGGPVYTPEGDVIGMVTSTLNQSILLQTTGNVAQNVNFGIRGEFLNKFLSVNDKKIPEKEKGSKRDVLTNTVQVLCYK